MADPNVNPLTAQTLANSIIGDATNNVIQKISAERQQKTLDNNAAVESNNSAAVPVSAAVKTVDNINEKSVDNFNENENGDLNTLENNTSVGSNVGSNVGSRYEVLSSDGNKTCVGPVTNGGRRSRKPKKKAGKRSSLKKSKKGAKKSRGGKSQYQQNQQQGGALDFSMFGKESHIETGADKSTSVAGSLNGGLHPVVPRINGGGFLGLVKGGNPLMSVKMPLMNGGGRGSQKPLMNGGSGCSIAANPQMGGRRGRRGGQKEQQQQQQQGGEPLGFSNYSSKGGQKQQGGKPLEFSPYSSKGGKRRTKGKGTTKGTTKCKGKRSSAKK